MSSRFDLSGKVILITGGCGGLGRVIVRHLLDWGALVAVNDVVEEREARQSIGDDAAWGSRIIYIQADASDEAGAREIHERTVRTLGMPDTVACHAGTVSSHLVSEFPTAEFDAIHRLNVRSSFLIASIASRSWKERGVPGNLIFTSSWVQDVPWPGITPYSSSKAAVRAIMRGFARELAPCGIRANAIAPGIVGVGMAKRQWDTEEDYRRRAQKAIPLGRLQPPETVAHAFGFLCSEFAAYMTGSVLLVDGGCSLYPMD